MQDLALEGLKVINCHTGISTASLNQGMFGSQKIWTKISEIFMEISLRSKSQYAKLESLNLTHLSF